MDSLNQIEIQNIRHIIGSLSNICLKIDYYKTLTNDTQITDLYLLILPKLEGLHFCLQRDK